MARISDLLLILGAYVIILLVRVVLTFGFRPVMAWAGSPLSPQEAAIMSWGGLRGAVSLALALVISQTPGIDAELRRQILMTTAGLVLLTVFVNGASTGWFLGVFGLTRRPASERLATLSTRAAALDHVAERVAELADSPDLRALDWSGPSADLAQRRADLGRRMAAVQSELAGADAVERASGYWHRALSVERREYWAKFGRGTLSPNALRALLEELDRHQDCLASGDLAPPLPRGEADAIRRGSLWQRFLSRFRPFALRRLSLRYDIARAEAVAAAAVLHGLSELSDSEPDVVAEVRATYETFLRVSRQRIEEMRINAPELVGAIEARLAQRIELNAEREELLELIEGGALGEVDGRQAVAAVEERMKRLAVTAVAVEVPSATELCRSSPLFADL
ncbi:MAG: cation:proton antiporter, partial [Myxococcota bacterium]